MGLVVIPWSSIANYAATFDFDEEQTEDLFYFIRRMDGEHLKKLAAKQKAAQQNGKKPARPRK